MSGCLILRCWLRLPSDLNKFVSTRMTCCSPPPGTCSAWQSRTPTCAPCASSHPTGQSCLRRAPPRASVLEGIYFDASELADEIVFLNGELLELSGQDGVGEIEAAEFTVVVKLILLRVLLLFLVARRVLDRVLILQVMFFCVLLAHLVKRWTFNINL